jgi:cbb3-type cytochrome oxidase maturation protein
MSVLIILIIVSVFVAGGFLIAFLWSVKSGQMDDDYTPSVRMLFDDEVKTIGNSVQQNIKSKIKTHL